MRSQLNTGSDVLATPKGMVIALLASVGVGALMGLTGVLGAGMVLALVFAVTYLWFCFLKPSIAFNSCIIISFFAIGLTRFVSGPIGLSVDALLLLALLAIFFSKYKNAPWENLRSDLMGVSLIWFLYNVLEIFNPEARSIAAWFYAVRGVSLYMIFVFMIILLHFNTRRNLMQFVTIWFVISCLGALYGIKQHMFGVSHAEQVWLDKGAGEQHILFGKLRVFSFYSDAGQFGASQGMTGIVALITALKTEKRWFKWLSWATAGLTIYGMMISGTRSAIFIPALGIFTYLVLSKNFRVLVLGLIVAGSIFYVLKYTYIGQGNYTINRIRTAFNPTEDASFQVRLENQKSLARYLKSRPMGGGVGTAGHWGQRFSPGTFLADTPTDSWYVRIWAEEGIIGLVLYLILYLYILVKAFFLIYKLQDPYLRQIMMGFFAGSFGLFAANYSNGYIGQIPTSLIAFACMAFMFISPTWDKEYIKKQQEA